MFSIASVCEPAGAVSVEVEGVTDGSPASGDEDRVIAPDRKGLPAAYFGGLTITCPVSFVPTYEAAR